jgi:hypothetical protein
VTRKEALAKYDEIYDVLAEDKELMLRVLLHQFGGVYSLWDIVHTHYTSLHEARDLDDEDLEMRVDEVAEAYRQVVDEIVEKELGLNE